MDPHASAPPMHDPYAVQSPVHSPTMHAPPPNFVGTENNRLIISVAGKHGSDGYCGKSGRDGRDGARGQVGNSASMGHNGGNGHRGLDGENGSDGESGGNAQSGQPGGSIVLRLQGDNLEQIILQGSCNMTANLRENQIFCDARGGSGGRSGAGGRGGNGGDGGRGGNGGHGRNANHPGERGGDGGDGGHGGDGGNGGNGGRGGSAGASGDGSDGGSVVIETSNPSLLMCVDYNVDAGVPGELSPPGRGGISGRGGSGGSGGSSGSGGSGGRSTQDRPAGHSGSSGRSGNSGSRGRDGHSGSDGQSARSGRVARNGTILLRVFDTENPGLLLEQGPTRYNVRVESYTVHGIIEDGIFEPGEEIVIRNVRVVNDGSLSVPAFRVALSMPPCLGFFATEAPYYLPEIKPGQVFDVPQEFRGIIAPDPRAVVNEKYVASAVIRSQAILAHRPFKDALKETVLPVAYPVQVALLSNPLQMGRGEYGRFRLEIHNHSTLDYGCTTGNGDLHYKIIMDKQLRCDEGQVLEGKVDVIPARSSLIIREFGIGVDDQSEFFERLHWHVELYLRGKKIEHATSGVRIAPNFVEDNNFDALFVTDQHITRREFLLYQRIFEGLGLTCNYWDVERYAGFSNTQTPVTWVDKYRGKLIVLPAAQSHDLMRLMLPRDLFSHFSAGTKPVVVKRSLLSSTVETEDSTTHSYDSGLVVIGGPPPLDLMNFLFSTVQPQPVDPKELKDIYLINNPAPEELTTKCLNYAGKRRDAEPSRHFSISSKFAPQKLKTFSYQLGTAEIRELPVDCLERLVCTAKGQEVAQFLSLDPFDACKTTVFPTDSRFFATLYSIVSALPIKTKVKLLRGGLLAREENWKFRTREGVEFPLIDIVKATLYMDLKEEFVFVDRPLYRLDILSDLILHGDPENYAFKDAIVVLWHVIHRLDKSTFWKGWSILQQLHQKRTQLTTTKKNLEKFLFSENMKRNVNKLDEIRIEAELDAKSELRTFTVLTRPLQSAQQMDLIHK